MSGAGERRRAGFTLIELLLVIVILAAIAGAAVATLETATGDARIRDEDTRNRLERLRTAILGPEGATTPQGFVADVGRLPYLESTTVPSGLRELFENPNAVPTWRGPYLRTLPGPTGAVDFPDGWGNVVAPSPSVQDQNSFGWHVHRFQADAVAPIESGDLLVQSRGDPAAPAPYPVVPLVRRDDYLLRIAGAGAQGLRLVVSRATAGDVELRCELDLPRDDGAGLWTRVATHATPTVPVSSTPSEVELQFGPDGSDFCPIGRRTLRVFSNGALVAARTIDVLARAPLPTLHVVVP